MDHTHHTGTTEPPFWKSKIGIALIMLAVIGIFYVAREHYGHLSQALPYLILLLCPLMHLFGHNHGGHSHSSSTAVSKDEERT
ncbi:MULTISPECIES: DUF2933 domain-containing protein [Pseudomonadaceae]|jgi:hypothetical protein|uniref:DUF2933 domain-containing protein n=2 Tax=Pseudomonadaceae TaxID=135621 RepID=A0A1H2LF94_9PSED|nr:MULTISPECIES: DUF2933 domain-containing protein [Pseudomonadaceae]WGL63301.1 DUF2933 domain-containing protein [Pseudomonas sp. CW003PS]MBG0843171.1 DUF2933 domain-containing protein [Pseudomonas toyotomiensis]MCJ8167676.1 DUF2933 domain-containing protein [Atopomonas sediminilitoris]MDH0702429.1 DUF2933 domain-containing protein [Pseudomonas toyotomiensis]MDI5994884.1 DUF2933 domain-containing protein [Pseudomonas sp. MDMC216]